jgi:hypothetical protein
MIRFAVLLPALAMANATAQTCRPEQVEVTTRCCDGAAGSLYGQVRIRNTTKKACLLWGVRKATARDESGQPVRVALRANQDLDKYGKGVRRAALSPGETAAVTVTTQEPLFDQNRCARRLRFEFGGVIAEWEMLACGPPGKSVQVLASGLYPAPDGK